MPPASSVTYLLLVKLWMFFFMYLVQGLPFGLQEKYIPLHFRNKGMQYTNLSLFRLIHLPWISKILMVPFIDKVKNKKFFATLCLFLMAGCYVLMSALNWDNYVLIITVLTLSNMLIVFQDMILDAMVIQNLNEDELGCGNLAQVIGYKIGIILGGGGIGILSETLEFQSILCLISMVQLCTGIIALFFFTVDSQLYQSSQGTSLVNANLHEKSQINYLEMKTECEKHEEIELTEYSVSSVKEKFPSKEKTVHQQHKFSLIDIIRNNDMIWMIVFVLIYKLGETGIISFFPLFLMDAGVKMETLHFWNGIIGQVTSILGSVFGGLVASNNFAIFCNLWRFTSLRAGVMFILLLFCLSMKVPIIEGIYSWKFMCSIFLMTTLSFISGTLTTVTFTLMMVVSKKIPPSHQTSHYSVLAVAELLGKLTMIIFMGPVIDLFGKNMTLTVYCVLNILVFPVLLRYPKSLQKNKNY